MLIRFQVRDLAEVAVNGQSLWAAAPAQDGGVRLMWDSAREIVVEASFADVGARLGDSFIAFETAAADDEPWFVNAERILEVIPHPQQADVCFLQGHARRLAVKGDLAAVLAKF